MSQEPTIKQDGKKTPFWDEDSKKNIVAIFMFFFSFVIQLTPIWIFFIIQFTSNIFFTIDEYISNLCVYAMVNGAVSLFDNIDNFGNNTKGKNAIIIFFAFLTICFSSVLYCINLFACKNSCGISIKENNIFILSFILTIVVSGVSIWNGWKKWK